MLGSESEAGLGMAGTAECEAAVDRPWRLPAGVSMSPAQRQVYDLFVLNLALQLFDAVATYQGLKMGVHEANPILVAAFAQFGVTPALLLFKAVACGLLLLLYRNHQHRIVKPALAMLAGVYCVMSLVPWLVKLGVILVHSV